MHCKYATKSSISKEKKLITSSLRKTSIHKIQKHKLARMTTSFSNAKYIREIETTNNINEKAKIFQDISFLQLTYKLLCRTKTINDLFVKETYENLTFAKDLYSPEKTLPNGFTAYKLLRQTVNFHLLVEGNDDWAKIDYHFMVNRTNKRFVLADNIKDKLIISFSPNLCVGYSSNKENGGRCFSYCAQGK